jgi:hypothetical protein
MVNLAFQAIMQNCFNIQSTTTNVTGVVRERLHYAYSDRGEQQKKGERRLNFSGVWNKKLSNWWNSGCSDPVDWQPN